MVMACPPEGVCSGLLPGFVYVTVITSPLIMALARVNWTFVPEMATVFTVRAAELTITAKAEGAGTILARDKFNN